MGGPGPAAIPGGGTYNEQTESWVLTPEGSSSGEPFRLWTIGNVNGEGGKGPIYDVKLAVAYESGLGDLDIQLDAVTTDGFGNFFDPSTPIAPMRIQLNTSGDTPTMGDGKPLPGHGIYGNGIDWQEFALGDFNLTDSPIADFTTQLSLPIGMDAPATGQINVYEVSVLTADGASAHGGQLHFDLYDHYLSGNKAKYKFAPFSHDADGDATIVPAPRAAMVGLVGCGLLLGGAVLRRRRGVGLESRDLSHV